MKQWITTMIMLGLCAAMTVSAADAQKAYQPKAGETVVKMTIEGKGDIYMLMYTKDAPRTTANFLKLVKEKFYDGIRFHRIVPGFVAQAGDPNSKTKPMDDPSMGTGGTDTIKFEPNDRKHEKGAIGLARKPDPDSGSCQFYICLEPVHQLDSNYVVFGKVVQGMDIVEKLQIGDRIKQAVVLPAAKK